MIGRRGFLLGAAAATLLPALARAQTANLGAVSVADFGVRSGTADQSAALQRAIDSAAGSGTPLFLPPGSYVAGNLVLRDRLRLVGVPGESRLVFSGSGRLASASNVGRVALEGLVLDGMGRRSTDDAPLLGAFAVADLSLSQLTLTGGLASAIGLERVGGRVADCTIDGTGDVGIESTDSTGLMVTGNTVADCGNTGILIHRWEPGEDGSIVSGNRVSGTRFVGGGTGEYGNGIHLANARAVVVSGNRVTDSALSAIRAFSSSDSVIDGNSCLRSGEIGIFAEFTFEGAVISDNIIDGAAGGISIANFDQGGRLGTVSGNIVRNMVDHASYPLEAGGFGYGISVEADVAISGNVVDTCALDGLSLGFGPYLRNVTATGNVLRSTRIGIAVTVVEDAGACLIADNLIASPRMGAIRGMRWYDIATGDLLVSGASAYRHLTLANNRAA